MEAKSIFISYSTKDIDKVRVIKRDIESANHRVWLYPDAVDIGDNILDSEEEGIKRCDYMLLMHSKNSLKSQPVSNEIRLASKIEAVTGRKKLFVIKLDDLEPKLEKGPIQYCDLSSQGMYSKELYRLLSKIESHRDFHFGWNIFYDKVEHYDGKRWFGVKLFVDGSEKLLKHIRDVDYHFHPDVRFDEDTDYDKSMKSRSKFSISYYSPDREIVFAVVNLMDGSRQISSIEI